MSQPNPTKQSFPWMVLVLTGLCLGLLASTTWFGWKAYLAGKQLKAYEATVNNVLDSQGNVIDAFRTVNAESNQAIAALGEGCTESIQTAVNQVVAQYTANTEQFMSEYNRMSAENAQLKQALGQ